MFTPGGVDFVGGYTFYQMLKNSFSDGMPKAGVNLGHTQLAEKTGEEVHTKIFESG